MKKLRRLWALLLLAAALCLALTGCGSSSKEGSVEERIAAYRERMTAAGEQYDKYKEAYNGQLPEKVVALEFDGLGNPVVFLKPNYQRLEEDIWEKTGNPNIAMAYTNYTDEYLYMVESLVKDYMAAHPGEEDPMGISDCKMDWSYYRRVVIHPGPDGWSEERDRLLKETFGQYAEAIFVEWTAAKYVDTFVIDIPG